MPSGSPSNLSLSGSLVLMHCVIRSSESLVCWIPASRFLAMLSIELPSPRKIRRPLARASTGTRNPSAH